MAGQVSDTGLPVEVRVCVWWEQATWTENGGVVVSQTTSGCCDRKKLRTVARKEHPVPTPDPLPSRTVPPAPPAHPPRSQILSAFSSPVQPSLLADSSHLLLALVAAV